MKCIIKADDFGLTEGINLAVMKSYLEGPVRNAGVMVNMPAAEQAVCMAAPYPDLCLGLHVNISVGKPVAEGNLVKSMVDEDGSFHSSRYCRQKLADGVDPVRDYEEALTEVEAQIQKFREMTGTYPDYMDGHAIHSHHVFRAMSKLARKYGIIHYSYETGESNGIFTEPFRAEPPYAFYEEGIEPEEYFTGNLCNILGHEYALLFMHPGYIDYPLYRLTGYLKVRTQDLAALVHPKTQAWLEEKEVETITYRQIQKRDGGN